MMNFEWLVKAQRVMWIKKLMDNNAMKWKQYFKYATEHLGGELIFSCDYLLGLLKISLPQFYMNLLEVWMDTNDFRYKSEIYRGNEIIFNNKFIRIEGKCVFYPNLYGKNIYRLKHIMDPDGNLRSVLYFQRRGLNIHEFQLIQTIYKTIPLSWKRNMKNINGNNLVDGKLISFLSGKTFISLNDIVSKKYMPIFLEDARQHRMFLTE